MCGLIATLLTTFNINSPAKEALYYALAMEILFLVVSFIGTLMLANN